MSVNVRTSTGGVSVASKWLVILLDYSLVGCSCAKITRFTKLKIYRKKKGTTATTPSACATIEFRYNILAKINLNSTLFHSVCIHLTCYDISTESSTWQSTSSFTRDLSDRVPTDQHSNI